MAKGIHQSPDNMIKKITAILAVLVMTVLSASAQKKLWTWKANDPDRYRRMEHLVMNEDGSGAFVLWERYSDGPFRSHLLVWVDKTGKVLLKQRYTHPPKDWRYENLFDYWRVYFTSKDSLVVVHGWGDAQKADFYKAGKNKAVFVKALPAQRMSFWGDYSFKGWVEVKGADFLLKGHPAIGDPADFSGYQQEESDQTVPNLDTLTAWKL